MLLYHARPSHPDTELIRVPQTHFLADVLNRDRDVLTAGRDVEPGGTH